MLCAWWVVLWKFCLYGIYFCPIHVCHGIFRAPFGIRRLDNRHSTCKECCCCPENQCSFLVTYLHCSSKGYWEHMVRQLSSWRLFKPITSDKVWRDQDRFQEEIRGSWSSYTPWYCSIAFSCNIRNINFYLPLFVNLLNKVDHNISVSSVDAVLLFRFLQDYDYRNSYDYANCDRIGYLEKDSFASRSRIMYRFHVVIMYRFHVISEIIYAAQFYLK